MANKLKNLEIEETSFVEQGANPEANIAFFKGGKAQKSEILFIAIKLISFYFFFFYY